MKNIWKSVIMGHSSSIVVKCTDSREAELRVVIKERGSGGLPQKFLRPCPLECQRTPLSKQSLLLYVHIALQYESEIPISIKTKTQDVIET